MTVDTVGVATDSRPGRIVHVALAIFLGLSAPTFVRTIEAAPSQSFATDYGPHALAIADFNADGRPDFAVANNGANSVTILLANPDGTRTRSDYATGTIPRAIAIGDLNADGRLDLAIANYGSNSVSILLGNPGGSFGAKTDYAVETNPRGIVLADLNADGKRDLVVVNFGSSSASVLLGNGNGTFAPRTDFSSGYYPYAVGVADLNADAKPDLIVVSDFEAASIHLGNGNGTFGAQTNFGLGNAPRSVAIADLNGDSKPDLVVTNAKSHSVSVLLGVGNGTFGAKTDFATDEAPRDVVIADLDGDMKLDLAVANFVGTVSVLLGNGNGTFGAKTDFGAGTTPFAIAIANLNADSRPDLAVVNLHSASVSVLFSNLDGTYGITPGQCVFRDFDEDGYGDELQGVYIEPGPPPPGYVADDTDCDDTRADIHPGAPEVCDGHDDDCDGSIDEDIVPSPASGIVAWWPGDGSTSSMTGANHGTAGGGLAYAVGRAGQAFSLDGGSYVEVPDAPSLEMTTRFTLDAWIYPTSASLGNSTRILSKASPGNTAYELLINSNNSLQPRADVSANGSTFDSIISPVSLNAGTWSHVAATFDAGLLTLYVDGSLVASKVSSLTSVFSSGTSKLNVGRYPGGSNYFVGRIDEPAVYNRALNATEIRGIYEAGYWGFRSRCSDRDQDGYCSSACTFPGDCDDTDAAIHPTASDQTCNGVDENCSGTPDDGVLGCVCTQNGPGLAGWWPANGNANDAIAGNHGTPTNGATFAAGKVGQAFSLDGTNDYIANLGTTSTYAFIENTGVFTINAWIKLTDPSALGQQAITAHTATTSENGHFFNWENSTGERRLRLALMKGMSGVPVVDASTPSDVITNSDWHHVAAVGVDGRITFYVDGVRYQAPQIMGARATGPASRAVDVGRFPYATPLGHFNGSIDELQIYDRALSSAEVRAIYNAGAAGMCGLGTVAVGDAPVREVGLELGAARPNPATRSTTFELRLTSAADVSAEVFDIAGHRVRTVLTGAAQAAGVHELTWDVRSTAGVRVAPGIYLMRVSTPGATAIRRVAVID